MCTRSCGGGVRGEWLGSILPGSQSGCPGDEDGAAPAQVRLPVLVAWSAWVAAGADDDGLLDAALAPLRDLGWDTTSVRRIHEILTGPRMRLLVVADGLDEVPAADRDGPVQR